MAAKKEKRFMCTFIDKGNCDIEPYPQEIMASDLVHALQKAAGNLPDDAVEARISLMKGK